MKLFWIFLAIAGAASIGFGHPAGQLNLKIDLGRSESSKDSSSELRAVKINGDQAVYDLSYSGRRGPNSVPLHRVVSLSADEVGIIQKILDEHHWLQLDKQKFERQGAMANFMIALRYGSRPILGQILFTGSPGDPAIETNATYKYVDSLLTEVFRILHRHDPEIEYVNVVR